LYPAAPHEGVRSFDKFGKITHDAQLMKAPHLVFLLLVLTAVRLPAASIIGQDMTVVTGVTESTVVGQLTILPGPAEPGVFLEIPVPLPRAAAATPASAYAAAMPSLVVGPRNFTPRGYRRAASPPGFPHDWELGVFQFHLPFQSAGRAFLGKVMYVQPHLRKTVPFFPLSPQIPIDSSKITFLPGNSHSLEQASRNSQPATLEDGMLIMRPVPGELILVRRIEVSEPTRVTQKKQPLKRTHSLFPNPFEGLFSRRNKNPEAPAPTPQSILPK
jgi:hypothetical protein